MYGEKNEEIKSNLLVADSWLRGFSPVQTFYLTPPNSEMQPGPAQVPVCHPVPTAEPHFSLLNQLIIPSCV